MKLWSVFSCIAGVSLAVIAAGCGGGGIFGGGNTMVTVTFTGPTPVAMAVQVGSDAFASATPGSHVTLTLPGGTTRYAIAFVCPPSSGATTFNVESVVESTTQDSTSLTESCFAPPATGTASGNASSAIPGTALLAVIGSQGSNTILVGSSGSFSIPMPPGPNDIAVVALDGSQNVLGAKIVRAQTVPGVVGGSGIALAPPGDATTSQFVTVTSVPPAFFSPSASVLYHTANGTLFGLSNLTSPKNPMPYAVVPPASTQPGDFYHYFSSLASMPPLNELIGTAMTTTSGGGAVTLALPAPWSFTGPTPAKLPTFTYIYSGFSGQPITAYSALTTWPASSTVTNQISIMATANFQNGAATITIPDFSSIPGFLAPAPTGTTVGWLADIYGGNPQTVLTLLNPPPNASGAFVQNGGQFTQP